MTAAVVVVLLPLIAVALPAAAAGSSIAQGVRVVDSVTAGDLSDEAEHHYAGSNTSSGKTGGRTWRSAAGSLIYSLRIYDDSPLTLVCVVADGGDAAEAFDVLVDGRKTATFTRPAGQAKAAELKVTLDLKDTLGRTAVVVKLAAHPGAVTARLVELRAVQEHLE